MFGNQELSGKAGLEEVLKRGFFGHSAENVNTCSKFGVKLWSLRVVT